MDRSESNETHCLGALEFNPANLKDFNPAAPNGSADLTTKLAGPPGVSQITCALKPFGQLDAPSPRPSRRRDCHSMAPPRTFIMFFNMDKQGVSSK